MLRHLQPVGLSHRWIDPWRYYMAVFKNYRYGHFVYELFANVSRSDGKTVTL